MASAGIGLKLSPEVLLKAGVRVVLRAGIRVASDVGVGVVLGVGDTSTPTSCPPSPNFNSTPILKVNV